MQTQTAKPQVTSTVAELVELRNLLLTAVNDFARAKRFFGPEYLNEVDGTYKASPDGTPERIGPAPWTLMDEACRSLHTFPFDHVEAGMVSVLPEPPRAWWLQVLTRAKLIPHRWRDDDAWNRELGELQRAANAVDAAAARWQPNGSEPTTISDAHAQAAIPDTPFIRTRNVPQRRGSGPDTVTFPRDTSHGVSSSKL